MISVPCTVITNEGSFFRNVYKLPEDYTMNELVTYLRCLGVRKFKLDTMHTFAEVPGK